MGRKFTVPYALYRTHGTINPMLAAQTGFTEDGDGNDLDLLFQALKTPFSSTPPPRGLLAVWHHMNCSSSNTRTSLAKLPVIYFSIA
jgi:CRISPR/Cas system type I-B associated protein Csh2 (Cas7 group RAMP superfamily)